jgi:hypothetical protein
VFGQTGEQYIYVRDRQPLHEATKNVCLRIDLRRLAEQGVQPKAQVRCRRAGEDQLFQQAFWVWSEPQ